MPKDSSNLYLIELTDNSVVIGRLLDIDSQTGNVLVDPFRLFQPNGDLAYESPEHFHEVEPVELMEKGISRWARHDHDSVVPASAQECRTALDLSAVSGAMTLDEVDG